MLFALSTATSMAVLSSGLGLVLGFERVQRRFVRAPRPLLATLAFVFGGLHMGVCTWAWLSEASLEHR